MCGRFALTLPHEAVAELFDAAPDPSLMMRGPRYNICPTQEVEVCRIGAEGREMARLRWGYIPHWYKAPNGGPLLINARGETIAEKPAFRAACRERRAVIIATGFYEWTRQGETRLPWYITRTDGAPLAFAAVWQDKHCDVREIDMPGLNHYDVIDHLGMPGSALFQAVYRQIRGHTKGRN